MGQKKFSDNDINLSGNFLLFLPRPVAHSPWLSFLQIGLFPPSFWPEVLPSGLPVSFEKPAADRLLLVGRVAIA